MKIVFSLKVNFMKAESYILFQIVYLPIYYKNLSL